MILNLAIHNTGKDDHVSKIVYNTYESNKDGNGASIKKEPEDKKNPMNWSIENIARAFRELYSHLNWGKVFDNLGEIENWSLEPQFLDQGFNQKQFQTLLQLFNKSKPQNLQFPLLNLLTQKWKSPLLQFTIIQRVVSEYMTNKNEKSIQFKQLKNKVDSLADLADLEKQVGKEKVEVW